MIRSRSIWTTVLLLGLAALCPALKGLAEPYEVDPTLIGVNVHGRVRLLGPAKDNVLIPVYRDSEYCGETVLGEITTVDSSSNGLSGVVVSLVGIERGKPLDSSGDPLVLEIESKKCRFTPHLSVAAVGTSLEIRNLDPILHNLHVRRDTRYGPTVINVIQPAGTRSVQKPFRDAGFFDVRCDVHAFMSAFIHVFDHPYFTITDSTGAFEMTKVPPGIYKLRIWHEQFGTREKTIKVPPGEAVNVEMDIGSRLPSSEVKPEQ